MQPGVCPGVSIATILCSPIGKIWPSLTIISAHASASVFSMPITILAREKLFLSGQALVI